MLYIDKAVDMRGSQIINVHTYESLVVARRCVAITTMLAWLSTIPLMIALGTSTWGKIAFLNKDQEKVFIHFGTYGEWRWLNSMDTTGEWITHFPSPPKHIARLTSLTLRHYHRAHLAFGIISMSMLLLTNLLALYTFYRHRYVFKRLTGVMYLITGLCIIVMTEVSSFSVDEWKTDVAEKTGFEEFDFDEVKSYGVSSILAFTVAAICCLEAIAMFITSKMNKGENAATVELEIEDRPVYISQ